MKYADPGESSSKRQIAELLRKWTVPSVRFLAATTYKQLEEINVS